MESIPELRKRVQEPVEHRNDLTGMLYGSRISIFITWFFLKRGWHANFASFLMLFTGLSGAVLLAFPGWPQVAGFFLLVTYYLFDCVDGELARYHCISHLKAAYYDYLAHVVVKSTMFLGLGIGLSRDPAVGSPWPIVVALVPILSVLFSKIASDLHLVLFGSKFILHRDRDAIADFMRRRLPARAQGEGAGSRPGRRGLSLGLIRELLLNFDVYQILFLVGAFLDMVVTLPAGLPAWLSFKMALFLFYAAALPLNFLDHVIADMTTNRLFDRVDEMQGSLEKLKKTMTDEEPG